MGDKAFLWCYSFVDYFLSGQKPHAINPGMSFEKQHVLRTGVFTISDGLRFPVYSDHQDLLEKRAQVFGSSNVSISSIAWSAKPGLDSNV